MKSHYFKVRQRKLSLFCTVFENYDPNQPLFQKSPQIHQCEVSDVREHWYNLVPITLRKSVICFGF